MIDLRALYGAKLRYSSGSLQCATPYSTLVDIAPMQSMAFQVGFLVASFASQRLFSFRNLKVVSSSIQRSYNHCEDNRSTNKWVRQRRPPWRPSLTRLMSSKPTGNPPNPKHNCFAMITTKRLSTTSSNSMWTVFAAHTLISLRTVLPPVPWSRCQLSSDGLLSGM